MAMRRFYWLKLKDDFFTSKRVKKLRKMANGDTYLIIYLKLQLMAMKSDGMIEWTGLEEDITDEIALDIDESPEDVKETLDYLLRCGLAERTDDTHYYFPFAVENTGSEASSAQRVRDYRSRKVLHCNTDVTDCNTNVTQVKQNCNGEIRDKRKEIRDKRLDTADFSVDNNGERLGDPRQKNRYGKHQNVILTGEELIALQAEFPDWEERIETLSGYIESTGKQYRNHAATIRYWAQQEQKKQTAGAGRNENVFLRMIEEEEEGEPK